MPLLTPELKWAALPQINTSTKDVQVIAGLNLRLKCPIWPIDKTNFEIREINSETATKMKTKMITTKKIFKDQDGGGNIERRKK